MRPSPPFTLPDAGAVLIALAYIVFCLGNMLLAMEVDGLQLVGALLKFAGTGLLAGAIAIRPRFHRKLLLLAPFAVFVMIGILKAYSLNAAADELMRFALTMLTTVVLFAYRDRLDTLLKVFMWVVISNDLFQVWYYFAYVTGAPTIIPIRQEAGIYLRAQGWIGFFSEFSFINFCAFLLCRRYYQTRVARLGSWVFCGFALLGISFKLLPALILYPLTGRRVGWREALGLAIIIGGFMVALATGMLDRFLELALSRADLYAMGGQSARAESYRVLIESLSHWNLLGEGLGSFGGPASVTNNSPLYNLYSFNWYSLEGRLATTDTFYPHLFVELGIFGGAIWLWFVLRYGQVRAINADWLLIVMLFCFDNLVSFGFVSPSYVFAALLMMYAFRQKVAPRMRARRPNPNWVGPPVGAPANPAPGV